MKKILSLSLSILFIGILNGQNVGIGTNNPAASAQLDVSSTSKGLLPPRMTTIQRNAIATPAPGLMIWCIDCAELQVYNGIAWKNISGSAACSSPLYPNVTICNQIWMTRNLDVVTYRNGDTIPQVTDRTLWDGLTTGAWCYYNNDPANGAVYGKLYNWYAVTDPRGLAPADWHVPSYQEWITLADCLGGAPSAGGKLKATTLWNAPNTGATNASGFTALPGGFLYPGGPFEAIGDQTQWWATTEWTPSLAWNRGIAYNSATLFNVTFSKQGGFYVRCVAD